MAAVKPALQQRPASEDAHVSTAETKVARLADVAPRRLPQQANSPAGIRPVTLPINQPRRDTSFQPRTPVITGEANYRGAFPVDGVVSGQLGGAGSVLTIKQRPRTGPLEPEPELNGELSFKDMLRINGHVAGKVFSYKGTLIVDGSAKVEAGIDVAVCIVSGIVIGDIIGHERVEVGSGAVVKGNIATRTLSIKPGAVFQGDCRMLRDEISEK